MSAGITWDHYIPPIANNYRVDLSHKFFVAKFTGLFAMLVITTILFYG